MLEVRILGLIATVIGRCEGPGEPGPGHPPAESVRVLGTLRRFLREGTPWRSLRATPGQASGSTLPRRRAGWAAVNPPRPVDPRPVGAPRGPRWTVPATPGIPALRGGDPARAVPSPP